MSETSYDNDVDLRHYLQVLRSAKLLIVSVALGMMTVALVASLFQSPVYEASAEVLIQSRASTSIFGSDGGRGEIATVETEVRVISSDPVRALVRDELGTVPAISASRVDETEVMRVQARSTDPDRTARIANAYARAYIDFRREQAVGEALRAGEAIQGRIDALQVQIDAVDAQISGTSSTESTEAEVRLRPRYASLVTQQGLLQQTLDQLQVDAGLQTGGVQLVRRADVPTSPVSPKPLRNSLAALVAGLVIGPALAFFRNHLDDSIKTKEDLERVGGSLLVLGVIPVIDDLKAGELSLPIQWEGNASAPGLEAYRSLRTSVQLLGVDRPLRVLQITSPMASEGKTSTVANLGTVLAAAGQRVVLVDLDLRRPRLHEILRLSNTVGFTSVFLGEASLTEATVQAPGEESLFLLPSGRMPANPSELLSSKRTSELLFELQSSFDVVLIDSAPILPVTDAIVLTSWVEATLIVARAGVTTQTQLTDAVALLRQVGAPIAGAVLNQATPEAGYGYGYGDGSDERRSVRAHTRGRAPLRLRAQRNSVPLQSHQG